MRETKYPIIQVLDDISSRGKDIQISSSNRYTNKDGKNVPRVTEVVSAMLNEESIAYWANSLGYKHISYRSALREAADKGTYTHSLIEHFLLYGKDNDKLDIPSFAISAVDNAYNSFKLWWDSVNKENKIDVVYVEKKIICKYFGGTLDCLLRVNDKYWLIDFKTSNHVSLRYFLQLAAYRYMLREEFDIEIDGSMVLLLNKDVVHFDEYIVDLSDPYRRNFLDECEKEFFALLIGFIGRKDLEGQFKELFG